MMCSTNFPFHVVLLMKRRKTWLLLRFAHISKTFPANFTTHTYLRIYMKILYNSYKHICAIITGYTVKYFLLPRMHLGTRHELFTVGFSLRKKCILFNFCGSLSLSRYLLAIIVVWIKIIHKNATTKSSKFMHRNLLKIGKVYGIFWE